jgi:hypothetical protein
VAGGFYTPRDNGEEPRLTAWWKSLPRPDAEDVDDAENGEDGGNAPGTPAPDAQGTTGREK